MFLGKNYVLHISTYFVLSFTLNYTIKETSSCNLAQRYAHIKKYTSFLFFLFKTGNKKSTGLLHPMIYQKTARLYKTQKTLMIRRKRNIKKLLFLTKKKRSYSALNSEYNDYTLISTSTPHGSSSFIKASTVLGVAL